MNVRYCMKTFKFVSSLKEKVNGGFNMPSQTILIQVYYVSHSMVQNELT